MSMHIGPLDLATRTLVIAEIGSNHNGDFAQARALLAAAAAAGADAVKFQVYRGERLVHGDLPAMAHVRATHPTQRARFQSLEFSDAQWHELASLAGEVGTIFLASVFDEDSADRIAPLVPAFKIASGDLTNVPLLRHVARFGKPVILSTGMATVEEIDTAIEALRPAPTILLHCVSRYPTPIEEANLRAIPFLASRFGVPVGYSDHTIGTTACIAAVALGASAIEKHFTFDKTIPFGDHKLSADRDELASLVRAIREVEQGLGRSSKEPGDRERAMRSVMRRSLYFRRALPAGTRIGADDLIALRPASGLDPGAAAGLTGRTLARDVAAEEIVRDEDFQA